MGIIFLFLIVQGLSEPTMAQVAHTFVNDGLHVYAIAETYGCYNEKLRKRVGTKFEFKEHEVTHTFYCYLSAPITKFSGGVGFLVSEYIHRRVTKFSDDGTGRIASLTVLINTQHITFSAYANYGHEQVKIDKFGRFLQRLENHITPRTLVGIDANTRLRKPAGAKIHADDPLGTFAPEFHSRCNSRRDELLWNFCKLHDLGALATFSNQKCRYTHVRPKYPMNGQRKRVKFVRNWIDYMLVSHDFRKRFRATAKIAKKEVVTDHLSILVKAKIRRIWYIAWFW